MDQNPLVSVIIPVYNGEKWINDCFDSILKQVILQKEKIELSVYNDSSTDNTSKLLDDWKKKISKIQNLSIVISEGKGSVCGVGYAKNQAICQSHGSYLCFQDIDDVMLPRRISDQLEEAKKYPDAIIGCQVKRIPEDSTPRFISWTNNLPQNLLTIQIYTSHGPTVLMPTWFFHRNVYEKAGKFSEEGRGTSEDLLFFYSHLDSGGTVRRVDDVLLIYRYHPDCTTFSVSDNRNFKAFRAETKDEKWVLYDSPKISHRQTSLFTPKSGFHPRRETIWNVRLAHLEKWILPKWTNFTIWNAGKQGRRFYRSLKPTSRKKVIQFCDVDSKKTGKFYEPYFKSDSGARVKIPIVHFTKARPPFITCVKLDLTKGQFERNLNSLKLVEGKDFIVFS